MDRVRRFTASFSDLRQQLDGAVADGGTRMLFGGGREGGPGGEAAAEADAEGGPTLSSRLAAVLASSHNVYGGAVLKEFERLDPASYTETNEVRVVVGTWNLNGRPPEGGMDLAAWLDPDGGEEGGTGEEEPDLVVAGFQEIVPLSTQNVLADGFQREIARGAYAVSEEATVPWEAMIDGALNRDRHSHRGKGSGVGEDEEDGDDDELEDRGRRRAGRRWVNVCRKQLVGVYMSVWAREDLKVHIHDVRMAAVGCGVLGVLGNKGAVVASMRVYDTTLCLVCSHLSSGDQVGDAAKRSADFADIVRRAEFPPTGPDDAGAPRWIGDHEHAIWLGDLNYRLNRSLLADADVRRLIAAGDWSALLEADELGAEVAAGRSFPRPQWREGAITFPPTYKLRLGKASEYSGDPGGEEGEKVRTPAWTDRVLYTAAGGCVEVAYASVGEYTNSDHRPVCAVLAVPFRFHPPDLMEAAVGAARRAADAAEMASRPRCELGAASLDLGTLGPGEASEGTLTLSNTGEVRAAFEFVDVDGERPGWVDAVVPEEGEVEAGGEVGLSVRVRAGDGGDGGEGGGAQEAILVLRVVDGRDFFVTVQVRFAGTCATNPGTS